MNRRSFLAALAAVAVAPLLPAPAATQQHRADGILYWVVVEGRNPFVFGVKDDGELRSFKKVSPRRFRDPEAAQAECDRLC